jgi:hypothetical protein
MEPPHALGGWLPCRRFGPKGNRAYHAVRRAPFERLSRGSRADHDRPCLLKWPNPLFPGVFVTMLGMCLGSRCAHSTSEYWHLCSQVSGMLAAPRNLPNRSRQHCRSFGLLGGYVATARWQKDGIASGDGRQYERTERDTLRPIRKGVSTGNQQSVRHFRNVAKPCCLLLGRRHGGRNARSCA